MDLNDFETVQQLFYRCMAIPCNCFNIFIWVAFHLIEKEVSPI